MVVQWTRRGGASAQGDDYETWWEYDGLGRKKYVHKHIGPADGWTDGWQDVKYEWDDASRLTRTTVEPESTKAGVQAQVTEYRYDAQGRRTLRILPDGRQTRTAFDAAGRVNTSIFASDGGDCDSGGTCR